MNVEIHYCVVWNNLPQASRLEEELKGNFPNININLIKGSGGIFKVLVEGKEVFNKDNISLMDNRSFFPDEGEITTIIKEEF